MPRKVIKPKVMMADAIDQALKEVVEGNAPTKVEQPEVKRASPRVKEPNTTERIVVESEAMVPQNQRIPQSLFDRIDAAFREERILRRGRGERFTKAALGIEAFEAWLDKNGY